QLRARRRRRRSPSSVRARAWAHLVGECARCARAVPVTEVRRARALGADHGRAEWRLGPARAPERRALGGLGDAAQDPPADTRGMLFGPQCRLLEASLRVEPRELGADAQSALGDEADPPPAAVVD